MYYSKNIIYLSNKDAETQNNHHVELSIDSLSKYLLENEAILSSTIVVVKEQTIKHHIIIHKFIVEYPEVSFLFEGKEDDILSYLFPVEEYLKEISDREKEDPGLTRTIKGLSTFLETKDSLVDESYKCEKDVCDFVEGILSSSIWDDDPDESLSKLLCECKKYIVRQSIDFTLICIKDQPNISALQRDYISYFDPSNIRNAIKQWKLISLNCFNNYERIQQSRKNNIGICVEEESSQCLLNCYSLFASGFRCIPVMSASKLKGLKHKQIKGDKIIVRDYDLQFPDEESRRYKNGINEVDLIRGFKYRNNCWENLLDHEQQVYWEKADYDDNIVFLVSYGGYKGLKIDESGKVKQTGMTIKNELVLPGITKPVMGIYYSMFRSIRPTQERFKTTLYSSVSDNNYIIKTSREAHRHSAPLDLYDSAQRMILRAERYYKRNKYLLSAIVSQEAQELLNGFHIALTLRAFATHAKAENALALDVLGGDEEILAEDANLRCKIIWEQVNRILAIDKSREDYEEVTSIRKKTKINVLNQIFSDCRLFCKEKEHFKAEDVFLCEMAHLNDGLDEQKLFRPVGRLLDKAINKLETYV